MEAYFRGVRLVTAEEPVDPCDAVVVYNESVGYIRPNLLKGGPLTETTTNPITLIQRR